MSADLEVQIRALEEYVRDLRKYVDLRMKELESDMSRRQRRSVVAIGIAILVGVIIGAVFITLWK